MCEVEIIRLRPSGVSATWYAGVACGRQQCRPAQFSSSSHARPFFLSWLSAEAENEVLEVITMTAPPLLGSPRLERQMCPAPVAGRRASAARQCRAAAFIALVVVAAAAGTGSAQPVAGPGQIACPLEGGALSTGALAAGTLTAPGVLQNLTCIFTVGRPGARTVLHTVIADAAPLGLSLAVFGVSLLLKPQPWPQSDLFLTSNAAHCPYPAFSSERVQPLSPSLANPSLTVNPPPLPQPPPVPCLPQMDPPRTLPVSSSASKAGRGPAAAQRRGRKFNLCSPLGRGESSSLALAFSR